MSCVVSDFRLSLRKLEWSEVLGRLDFSSGCLVVGQFGKTAGKFYPGGRKVSVPRAGRMAKPAEFFKKSPEKKFAPASAVVIRVPKFSMMSPKDRKPVPSNYGSASERAWRTFCARSQIVR